MPVVSMNLKRLKEMPFSGCTLDRDRKRRVMRCSGYTSKSWFLLCVRSSFENCEPLDFLISFSPMCLSSIGTLWGVCNRKNQNGTIFPERIKSTRVTLVDGVEQGMRFSISRQKDHKQGISEYNRHNDNTDAAQVLQFLRSQRDKRDTSEWR